MKITIHYWKDDSGYMPFCATSNVEGEHYFGCGHNFKLARQRLLFSIEYQRFNKTLVIPPDEEVNI